MMSVISKRKRNKDYYYLVESARMKGKPRIVSQVYLITADRIIEMAKRHKIKPERFSVLELGLTSAIYPILKEPSSLMSIADTHDLYFDTTNFSTFIDQNAYAGKIVRKAHINDSIHVAMWLLVDSRGVPLLNGMCEANRTM
ncbi:MAG: hypothetical protein QXP36_04330 [Conexivisphaerales archaeon]